MVTVTVEEFYAMEIEVTESMRTFKRITCDNECGAKIFLRDFYYGTVVHKKDDDSLD